jgi:hypothetical protein
MLIQTYILTNDSGSETVHTLAGLFSNPVFNVTIVDPKMTKKPENLRGLSHDEEEEIFRFMVCLEDSQSQHPDNDLVVLRDDSVTILSPDGLADLMSIIDKYKSTLNFDLFYLNKYLDKCDQYTNSVLIPNYGFSLVRTKNPNGVQAIYITKGARDKLLGTTPMKENTTFRFTTSLPKQLLKEVNNGTLLAGTTTVNIFNYNPSNAVTIKDYQKTCECYSFEGDITANICSSYVYALILIILVIVVAILITVLVFRKKPVAQLS